MQTGLRAACRGKASGDEGRLGVYMCVCGGGVVSVCLYVKPEKDAFFHTWLYKCQMYSTTPPRSKIPKLKTHALVFGHHGVALELNEQRAHSLDVGLLALGIGIGGDELAYTFPRVTRGVGFRLERF